MPRSRHSLPDMVMELWRGELLVAFHYPHLMRMITPTQLDVLIEESADIPQLKHLHDALRELYWRRQQGKVEVRIQELIEEIKKPWYARLKFW
jgi:hypothetical protein